MLTASQIAAIIGLLMAFGVDPITTANVQTILERQNQPTITSGATTTMAPKAKPAPVEQPAPAPTPAAQSQARIEIINPLAGKGADRDNLSTKPDFDELGNLRNEIDIGAIVYGVDGQPTKGETVAVHVKSPSGEESVPIVGTGNVTTIYKNGRKDVVPYYHFHYQFGQAGTYTITFNAVNLSEQIKLKVRN